MSVKNTVIVALVTFCLTATLFSIVPTWSTQVYDPWADVSGPTLGVPDGKINMRDIAYEVSLFGTSGTPIDRTHEFLEYDSGWMDITDQCGQYFNVTHNLNSTDLMVGIEGKMTLDSEVHQRDFGLREIAQGWNKTYGGPEGEFPYAMVNTSDGGFAIAGEIFSDFYLIKTDGNGNLQWNKSYGGPDMDTAYALVQTSDGGYALAGSIAHYVPNPDRTFYYAWFVKTDAAGNMQWNQTYGGGYEQVNALVQASDGGYALAGYTRSFGAGSQDYWLVKTDENGTMQWNKTYGGPDNDDAYALAKTSDGGYALAGNGFANLVKTDSEGNMQWSRAYGGSFYSMVQSSDGGYALAGSREVGLDNSDFLLVKTDATGNLQWNRTYGGEHSEDAQAMVQTMDGGYALAGWVDTYLAPGLFDFWFVKTDQYGNMQWNKTYGGTGIDIAYGLVQTADGAYALAGGTTTYGSGSYDFWLIKTGAESGLAWIDSTANTITLYRGMTDEYWNYVRVYIWKEV
jgi:hypothetical protein